MLEGTFHGASFATDPIFGLSYSTACPGVPDSILNPSAALPNPAEYDELAPKLSCRIHDNFRRFAHVDPAIRAAGPRQG